MLNAQELKDKEFTVSGSELLKLPLVNEMLEGFISDYSWIKDYELSKEEAIEKLNRNPLKAEIVEYGIHGLKVSVEMMERGARVHWNVYDLDDFKPILFEHLALCRAEKYGIIDYTVDGNKMIHTEKWYEGYGFVYGEHTYNLENGEYDVKRLDGQTI